MTSPVPDVEAPPPLTSIMKPMASQRQEHHSRKGSCKSCVTELIIGKELDYFTAAAAARSRERECDLVEGSKFLCDL